MLARNLHAGTRIKHPGGHYGYAQIVELHVNADKVWGKLSVKGKFENFDFKPKDEVEARR